MRGTVRGSPSRIRFNSSASSSVSASPSISSRRADKNLVEITFEICPSGSPAFQDVDLSSAPSTLPLVAEPFSRHLFQMRTHSDFFQ